MVAGASGTHSICVCITHQNVKLMYMGSNLKSLSGGEIPDYKTCLAALRCSPATTECYLGNCSECPGSEKLREAVLNIMDANLIDTVEFRQWTTTDRANLETKVLPIDDFVDCSYKVLKSYRYTISLQRCSPVLLPRKRKLFSLGSIWWLLIFLKITLLLFRTRFSHITGIAPKPQFILLFAIIREMMDRSPTPVKQGVPIRWMWCPV